MRQSFAVVVVVLALVVACQPPLSLVAPTPSPSAAAQPIQQRQQAQPSAATPSGVYYANCAAARRAGAAPLYRGQPGYRAALDRDRDGVACE